MNETQFQEYLEKRYYDQIDWYDRKSQKYKKLYLVFQSVVIVLAAVTPVLVALGGSWEKWLAVAVSALVAIGTSLLKAFKHQEVWISYRTTSETLKKEIYYYQAQIGEYGSSGNPIQLFVSRVESLLSQENTQWLSMQTSKDPSQKQDQG